jgi:hypothetical protein
VCQVGRVVIAWNVYLHHILLTFISFAQFLLALRAQVAQGNMTQQQALERLAMMQASSAPPFQEQSAPQQLPAGDPSQGS